MSLYHEGADVLVASSTEGGSLKSRIFGRRNIKSSPGQLYALVFETCKWSLVLKEVIDAAAILSIEKKVRVVFAIFVFFFPRRQLEGGMLICSSSHPFSLFCWRMTCC